ncbi:NAD(P)H-dependent oxidoreductase [Pseudoalteromonas sp. T1lg76]|uniref:NAD(P)H-dependent oxidoreductase n=1 Tax=Pseudoalteromonas sp. T1lg76 TaxID=2077103 RepID=UPI000CF7363E|nr:NAD(P)H-dependent oxidoreductase [Pseudoalteromonas sp. T1lg76]
MEFLSALEWRYAVKQFSQQMVPEAQLQTLLQAATLSPSAYGLQPYRLILVRSKLLREQLVPHSYGQDKVANSSHLLVFAAQTNIGDETVERYIARHSEVTGTPIADLQRYGDHLKSALASKTPAQRQEWAHQQAYIALGNLLTCAAQMRIDTCPMSGIDAQQYDRILGLTKRGLTTTVICPIGYRHQEDSQCQAAKVRFDYAEMVDSV